MKQILRQTPVAAACATLVIAGAMIAGASGSAADPNANKVRILAWSKDAKLSRKLTDKELQQIKAKRKPGDKKPLPTYKALAGVKAGALLEVPDIIETKKSQVDIKGGTLTFTRLAPNTVVKYTKIDPTRFEPTTPANLLLTVERGSALMRIGTMKQPSRVQIDAPKTITGAAGTAYSVTVKGQKTTLLVAEGQVQIASEITPDDIVVVGEREKLIFDAATGDPFPTQAVPATNADEAQIRALLSLPVTGLNGYSYGRELKRGDAGDVIVTRVQPITRKVDSSSFSSYKPRWGTPDRVYLTGRSDFWTTDSSGSRRHAGSGLMFEAISPDGSFIIGSKANKGLWRVNWDGSGLKQISRLPLGEVRISPNGKRLIAGSGWRLEAISKWNPKKRDFVATGQKRWKIANKSIVVLSTSGGKERTLIKNPPKGYGDPIWKRGGDRLIYRFSHWKGSFQYIDGDTSPPRVLVSGAATDSWFGPGEWMVSPMGKWLSGSLSGKATFIRLSDRKTFRHEAGEHPIILVGEKTAKLSSGDVVDIENPAAGARPFDGSVDIEYPYPQLRSSRSNAPLIDGSLNGELITYYTSDFLASVADSLNPAINTTTAAGVPQYTEVHWINGFRALYTNGYENRVFVDYGVKKGRNKGLPEPPKDDKPNANAPINFAGLLGSDEQGVVSKLGPPKERLVFNSLYVLHLIYEPASLGQAKMMFTTYPNNPKRLFMDQLVVGSDRDRSPSTWVSLLGLTEENGWRSIQQSTDDTLVTWGLKSQNLQWFTKRMPDGKMWKVMLETGTASGGSAKFFGGQYVAGMHVTGW
jgi:hypothetical protein